MLPNFFTRKPVKFLNITPENNYVCLVWLIITLLFSIQGVASFRYNNYLIFENTFRNLIHQQNLYNLYPAFHEDANHYGPVFSVLIAPFAILPNQIALFLWNIFNCLILFKSIQMLDITVRQKNIICWIAVPVLIVSMLSEQFNPTAGALIILSFTQLNVKKGFWSAAFIVLGTFIKLYGIMGLAFFFFVKDKPRFILYLIFWMAIFFALPMLFSSPAFIIQSYQDWFNSLVHKNQANVADASSDLSILGFVRSLAGKPEMSNLPMLLVGCIIFMLPFINIRNYQKTKFKQYILASALLFPVLFSSGAEDCTYIISITGVGIWYIYDQAKLAKHIFLGIMLIFACNLPLAIFPKFGHQYPVFMTMLSVPYFVTWLVVVYKACLFKYQPETSS